MFTDAAVVGCLTDGAVIVTRHGSTHREALRLTCEALQRVKVPIVGLVVNDFNVTDDGYGYKHSYSEYYEQ